MKLIVLIGISYGVKIRKRKKIAKLFQLFHGSKSEGSLGIRKIEDINAAFLAK